MSQIAKIACIVIFLCFAYLYKGEKEKEKEDIYIYNPAARYIDWLSRMMFVFRIKTSHAPTSLIYNTVPKNKLSLKINQIW